MFLLFLLAVSSYETTQREGLSFVTSYRSSHLSGQNPCTPPVVGSNFAVTFFLLTVKNEIYDDKNFN